MSDQNPMLPDIPNRWSAKPSPAGLALAVVFLVVAAGMTALTRSFWPETSGLFLFFAAVLLSATRFGFWVGIASAMAAFAAFNFLFVEPLYTFQVEKPADLVALAEFLLVASLTGFLAGRLREEADAAKARADVLEVLSDFAAELALSVDTNALLGLLPRFLSGVAKGPAMVLRQSGCGSADEGAAATHLREENLILIASYPPDLRPDPADQQAAERCLRRQAMEPAVLAGWEGSSLNFVPLGQGGIVMGYALSDRHAVNRPFREQALAIIARQARLALDRSALSERAEAARIAADHAAIRAALLTSLSHDLRTPLATILGSVTTLREFGGSLDAAARDDLELAIEEETRRLSRHVDNLLHMTRLQAGLAPRLTWVDPAEVIQAAVTRAKRAFPDAGFHIMANDLPLIRAEAGLLEQALFNLIDNAVKFSIRPARVDVTGEDVAGEGGQHGLRLTVRDFGTGIAADQIDRIFEAFYRAAPQAVSGTGLGLTICQGIAALLGGTLTAQSPLPGGGSAFHLDLPLKKAPTA